MVCAMLKPSALVLSCHWCKPWQEVVQAGEDGEQAVLLPSFFGAHRLIVVREGFRLFGMVEAGPGDHVGAVGVALQAGVEDEAFLGYVEFATQAPCRSGEEVFLLVLGRDWDVADLLALVFEALEVPGAFPLFALAEPGFLVAEYGEESYGFVADELADFDGKVVVFASGVEREDGAEVGVMADAVSEALYGEEFRVFAVPDGFGFEAVEEPRAEGVLFEIVPLGEIPAALVFGLFDEGDVTILRDAVEAALDKVAVGLGPVRGDLGDWAWSRGVRTTRFRVRGLAP